MNKLMKSFALAIALICGASTVQALDVDAGVVATFGACATVALIGGGVYAYRNREAILRPVRNGVRATINFCKNRPGAVGALGAAGAALTGLYLARGTIANSVTNMTDSLDRVGSGTWFGFSAASLLTGVFCLGISQGIPKDKPKGKALTGGIAMTALLGSAVAAASGICKLFEGFHLINL